MAGKSRKEGPANRGQKKARVALGKLKVKELTPAEQEGVKGGDDQPSSGTLKKVS